MFKRSSNGLNILFVATEAAPFVKVGGLGSVMLSLPAALRKLGHDARVFLPRYLEIGDEQYSLQMVQEGLAVPTNNEEGPSELICNVKYFEGGAKEAPVPAYFLENQEYYEQRANVYGYADDPVRWALLCRGALEFLRTNTSWKPDVIVASDWATGLLPNYLRTIYKDDERLDKIATVFSIHNLSYQGMFDHNFVQEMDYDDGHSDVPSLGNPRLLKINGMRRGIMYADMINTVSPTYAKEIMTKEYGEGLDDLLRERRAFVHGILNGIDYSRWNPSKDPYLEKSYSRSSLGKRAANKAALQNRFGLTAAEDKFVLGIVSRLTGQKGFELLHPIADTLLLELPLQLVVLGEGDSGIMKFFYELETKYPGQVATHLKFDEVLPHLIYAGADSVLIPSRYEPSGLAQMEAMAMGAVPIVRKTGGLADTVIDFTPGAKTGTGFTFENFDPMSCLLAVGRAVETWRHADAWRRIQERAMAADFSWESSAQRYAQLFSRALELRRKQAS